MSPSGPTNINKFPAPVMMLDSFLTAKHPPLTAPVMGVAVGGIAVGETTATSGVGVADGITVGVGICVDVGIGVAEGGTAVSVGLGGMCAVGVGICVDVGIGVAEGGIGVGVGSPWNNNMKFGLKEPLS